MKTETTTAKPAFDPEVPPREGFIFYRTFYEALASMKPRARLRLYDAIMKYALYGEKPTDLNFHNNPPPVGCQRTETASKVQGEGNQKE